MRHNFQQFDKTLNKHLQVPTKFKGPRRHLSLPDIAAPNSLISQSFADCPRVPVIDYMFYRLTYLTVEESTSGIKILPIDEH